jgi:hypothetical protein
MINRKYPKVQKKASGRKQGYKSLYILKFCILISIRTLLLTLIKAINMTVTAIVEKGSDGFYSIYSDQEINNHSFGGYGESVEAAKADFMLSINEAKEMIMRETGTTPNEYADLQVTFKFDIASLFNYFDWINVSKFAQYAGINESKMRQYKSGVAFAGERTTNRILTAIKKMGAELSAASL